MTTQPNQPQNFHKSKTIAALLATTVGGLGLHRFYLAGCRDRWGWLHLASVVVSMLIYFCNPAMPVFFAALPFVISILAGFIASLMIGTTSDEKWDAQYNANSGKKSDTGWPIAVILVLTLAIGATTLIAVIARTFDLLYTGGLYG